jgi:hypothetical protein
MSQQMYEVRGLKFISISNGAATEHRCTFAISLPLASGSYWVSHYLFLDDAGYSGHVMLTDPRSVVAKGSGALQGHLSSDALYPKEVLAPPNVGLAPRSKAKLKYIRKKGTKLVAIQIDVWAKTKQTVQFNMLEETAASADDTIEMDGKISLAEQRGWVDQVLLRQPWGAPSDIDYSAA